MAKRRKSGLAKLFKSPLITYGIYGAIAYFGYNWLFGQQQQDTSIPVVIPEPQVSAYPTSYLP